MSDNVIQFPKVHKRHKVVIEHGPVPTTVWVEEKWPVETVPAKKIDFLNDQVDVAERSKQAVVRELFEQLDRVVAACGRELSLAVLRTAVKSIALQVE